MTETKSIAGDARRSPTTSRFLKFLAVGGFAAAINFSSRIVLSHWLNFGAAIVLAYLLGLVTAFVLNRRYVFVDATNRLHHQLSWFVVVNVLALAQTLLVSLVLAKYILPYLGISWHAEEIAHAAGIVTPIFSSYIGHRRWSFRSNR